MGIAGLAIAFLCFGQIREPRPRVEHILFPAAQGYWWRYEGTAGQDKVQVRVQITRVIPQGRGGRVSRLVYGFTRTATEEVYAVTPGQVARESAFGTSVRLTPPLPVIKSPMAPGRSWTWNGLVEARKDVTVPAHAVAKVGKHEIIETKAGIFRAYRVDLTLAIRLNGERLETMTTCWYAPYVGMVRQLGSRIEADGKLVTVDLSLSEYSLRETAPTKGGSLARLTRTE